jgi:hypothetical protein
MSYVAMGETPDQLFARRLAELRQAKTDEAAGGPPAPKSNIKWWCWDSPGFKDCHPMAFRAAQADCEAMGQRDQSACIVPRADYYSQGCPCPASPPPDASILSGITGNTWLVGACALGLAYVVFWPNKERASA